MSQPTIGRVVHYRLTEYDAKDINRRRKAFHEHGGREGHPGVVGHVGNSATEGDVYPAMIVRVFNESTTTCNLQVLLDGTDTYWATSRTEGDEPGRWSWPARV